MASDVACLLRRFALQQSFSADTGGGERASNARLILPLLQLGRHLLSTADAAAASLLTAAVEELGAETPLRVSKVHPTILTTYYIHPVGRQHSVTTISSANRILVTAAPAGNLGSYQIYLRVGGGMKLSKRWKRYLRYALVA